METIQNNEPPLSATDSADLAASAQPRGKRNVAIVAGTMVVDGADASLINSLFPVIQASLGLASSALGVLLSVSRLVSLVSGPLMVFLTKRFSRKAILSVAGGFWGIWSIAAGFSQSFTQLLIFYSIAAAGAMAGHIFLPTIVGDSFVDAKRARVIGWVYSSLAIFGALVGPLIGQLSRIEEGWRYGFFAFGALNILMGIVILVWFREPGIGAIDGRADGGSTKSTTASDLSFKKIGPLFKIPSFVILSVSRLISPHPIMASFAVVLLVQAHGISVAVAATIMAPFGIGYLLGNILIGYLGDWANTRSPNKGRIMLLQIAQFVFGAAALVATQVKFDNLAMYAIVFAIMGSVQGWNPILNRPIVMAVVAPELRAPAFGFIVSIVETLSFSLLALITGFLSDAIGIQGALFWTVVVLVFANGALLTALYPAYARDRARLEAQLQAHNG